MVFDRAFGFAFVAFEGVFRGSGVEDVSLVTPLVGVSPIVYSKLVAWVIAEAFAVFCNEEYVIVQDAFVDSQCVCHNVVLFDFDVTNIRKMHKPCKVLTMQGVCSDSVFDGEEPLKVVDRLSVVVGRAILLVDIHAQCIEAASCSVGVPACE